jgi:hypothetical protein
LVAKMKQNTTPKEAVWKSLLELEPKLAQMEEPDVPRLTDKFLDELQLSAFVLVPLTEFEKLKGTKKRRSKSRFTVQPKKHSPKVDVKSARLARRFPPLSSGQDSARQASIEH